jgi:hypothetical protein
MEMAQKVQKNQQVQQVNQVAWPTTFYLTPEMWLPLVPVHVVDGEELHRLINELWRAGINVQPGDVTPIYLVQAHDDKIAIYERPSHQEMSHIRVRRYRIPGGGALYEWEWVQGWR